MTGDPPPLEYQSAGTRDPVRPAWVFAGVATALAAGPGVAFLGLGLGTILESGQYAGLGGLMIGTALGGILSLVCLVRGIIRCRAPDGRRRGFGIGLLIGAGLTLLWLGICFLSI